MRILSVVGARPQFVSLGPIVEAVQDGWNILGPQLQRISAVAVWPFPQREQRQPHGDALAAQRVADALLEGSQS